MAAFIPTVQHLHFVGIGGIGMSGIAEILHNLGYIVSGSDLSSNRNTQRLEAMGVQISIGHHEDNIKSAHVLITSSAVNIENPEVLAARAQHIPVIPRAEMLAEIMRLKRSIAISGTHGKTTTTSMIAALLDTANMDPTVINGGILNAYSTNARLGTGEWCVVEADESDGSFVKLPATVSIVTNIDLEHMDYYKTPEALYQAFRDFVHRLPFYGLAIVCADHPTVQSEILEKVNDRRVVTYGFSEGAHVRGLNLRSQPDGSLFDILLSDETRWCDMFLPMVGQHNVQNALSMIAVAQELQIPESVVRQALDQFKGVQRRFTYVGVVDGVTVIDDYAHHPVEIQTVIQAARQAVGEKGRIISVVQPHRYTRLSDLFGAFSKAFSGSNAVIVTPVFGAGEDPIPGVNAPNLATAIREQGQADVFCVGGPEDIAPLVKQITNVGDYVLCMGAGTITKWAHELPEQLRQHAFNSKTCQPKIQVL